MKYSIIVPVYNRPDEVDELLESLCQQRWLISAHPGETEDNTGGIEVIIVEDGSAVSCKEICLKYAERLNIHYYLKENGGPGPARNYGVERATGDYVIILDSDVVLPPDYLTAVHGRLTQASAPEGETGEELDSFGGPDAAHPDFTPIQKAISYSMTSFFTTGGIRGGKKQLDKKFYPRSFNMGIRREVYNALGGFSKMRFGEDVDFSYRLVEAGYSSSLIPEAWVWHKRRANFRQFFKQVHNSGIARINLMKRHPGTLKLVHMLPALVTLTLGLPVLVVSPLIFIDSSIQNRSLKVGLLSVPASFIQLVGYGTGFLRSWWQRCVLGRDEFEAFKSNFYK